jgi:hypothetical protein
MGFSVGEAINGGTSIASVLAASTGDGVVVKEAAGRIVHIAHAAHYNGANPWGTDANTTLMMTNAVRWAARCL